MNRTVLKKLSYIGAAIHQGQPIKGVAKGPQVLRHSGLFETLKNVYGVDEIKDFGDISFETLSKQDQNRQPLRHMVNNLHQLSPLLHALSNKIESVFDQRQKDEVILNVGGDHSIASATIHAALRKNPNLKVIWVDAHADFVNPNLKGTPSQNYHGMPLSHISGVHTLPGFDWIKQLIPFQNIVLIGIRDIDNDEFISLKKHKVKCFSMDHVEKYGIGSVMTQALQYLDPKGEAPFHISYDVDGIDPYVVNQTGTVFRDGLSHRQACHIVRRIVNQRNLVSMDVVEINTELGTGTPRPQFRDQQFLNKNNSESVGMAVDLVTSLAVRNLTL